MSRVNDQVEQTLADAGVRGWVHARPVTGGGDEVDLHGGEPVAMASLFKLPLALAWSRAVDRGDLDPLSRLTLLPETRTPGATGISVLQDSVEMSARDTVRMMLVVSDNAAADLLLELVGVDAVNDDLASLGLRQTAVRRGAAGSLAVVRHDTHTRSYATSMRALAAVDRQTQTSEYDSALASVTTAADLTRLLSLIWTGRAASAASCAFLRDSLARQAWRHRLGSGFPHDDVVVAGKTGTLGTLRHEAAVVTFPDEVPVAVAVLTRAARAETYLPSADAAIGAVARIAVNPLRRPRGPVSRPS